MYLSDLLAGFITGASLIIAIGAQNAFILRQGLQKNYVGLIVTICSLSDIILILSGIAGIGKLAEVYPGILQFLRFGGAGFLAFYGLMAAKRAISTKESLKPAKENTTRRSKIILTCFAFILLNPHVYLDLMVLGSIATHYPDGGQWLFGMGACTASILWFISLGYGARFLQPLFQKPKTWQILDGFIAVFMIMLSLALCFHSSRWD